MCRNTWTKPKQLKQWCCQKWHFSQNTVRDTHIFTSLTKKTTKAWFEITHVWYGSQFMWVTSVLRSKYSLDGINKRAMEG